MPPSPRPNAKVKTEAEVKFLLSQKSPLRPNQKQQIKAELRHGHIVIRKDASQAR